MLLISGPFLSPRHHKPDIHKIYAHTCWRTIQLVCKAISMFISISKCIQICVNAGQNVCFISHGACLVRIPTSIRPLGFVSCATQKLQYLMDTTWCNTQTTESSHGRNTSPYIPRTVYPEHRLTWTCWVGVKVNFNETWQPLLLFVNDLLDILWNSGHKTFYTQELIQITCQTIPLSLTMSITVLIVPITTYQILDTVHIISPVWGWWAP